ncbi:MAG TPA: sigma-70 family RNA polymerase sigma factor, partial [Chitinophagaceae bacterium]
MDKKDEFLKAIEEKQCLIFKVASVYTNSNEDRSDLMQEIIYQLWKSFDSFSQKSSLSTWMYRVAMNTAIYHLKLEKRKIKTFPLDGLFMDDHEMNNTGTEEKWLLLKQHIDNLNLLDKALV